MWLVHSSTSKKFESKQEKGSEKKGKGRKEKFSDFNMNLEFLKNKVFFTTCPAILTALNLFENSGWLMSPYT